MIICVDLIANHILGALSNKEEYFERPYLDNNTKAIFQSRVYVKPKIIIIDQIAPRIWLLEAGSNGITGHLRDVDCE
jgi:hypothetical protein